MAASDHLSPKQFFHGTIETLKPGDIIKPRISGGHAWASTDLNAVIDHTRDRTVTGLGVNYDEWPVHHGNVYEVEPRYEGDPTLTNETMSGTEGAVASKLGFKVKSQVASVLGTENQRKDAKQYFPDFDPSKESYVKNGRKFGRE
jgi:hypothetical protein